MFGKMASYAPKASVVSFSQLLATTLFICGFKDLILIALFYVLPFVTHGHIGWCSAKVTLDSFKAEKV